MRSVLKISASLALIFVFCSAFGQVAKEKSKEAQQKRDSIQILSDTKGYDFGPYLETVIREVRRQWTTSIPKAARAPKLKQGVAVVEFTITRDGRIDRMVLASPSGDKSLDFACLDAIKNSTPFRPLPTAFAGSEIRLRFPFYYNPDKDSKT